MSGDINMDSNSIVKVHHLGIGTVSPLSPLHINDSTGTYGQIRLSNGATSNVWQRVDSAEFRVDWFSSVNRKVNILNSGAGNINVGIGTASPAKTLDVSGTLNVTGATTLGSTLNGHTIPGGTGTLALTSNIPTLGGSFVDSAQTILLIDANALDSGRATSLVDSSYIQHRTQIGISNIDFGPTQIRFGSGADISFIERHTSGYFNFKHNDSNQIRLGDTTGVIIKGPKIKLQLPGTDGTALEVHDSGISVFNHLSGAYGKLNRHTIPQGAGTLALTSDISTLTLGNDFIDSDQAKILIDANALDSGRAISLIDSAYIQQRRPAESRFVVVNNGSSAYRFTGDGFSSSSDNPTLYLQRGKTYSFVVSASGHPFQIRTSSGGSAYNTGVTNNGVQTGTLTFTPDMNAPDTLYYQCTAHSGMIGTIKIFDFNTFVDSGRVSSIITADVDAAFVAALGTSAIPNLPTSKITSGTFDSARIPVFSTSDITSGTFDSARIPVISASDIGTGTIDSDRLPTGVFGGGGGGGSGISGITVQEEGSSLSTLATALNFVGSAVTATGSGATKTITITGGSGSLDSALTTQLIDSAYVQARQSGGGSGTLDSSLTTALIDSSYIAARVTATGVNVQDEGSALSTTGATLNFVGNGVTATGSGATKTITIPGVSASSTFQSDRITITEFTADSGQTSFTGLDYTVGKTQVFLNGIQLVNTLDYTATNGSSVVLGTGADSGNTVTVVSHKLQDQLFSAATTIKNYFYTNTDSQNTTFSGADDHTQTLSYTPSRLQVYLNGILLKDSDDYTASNGSSIVLTQGADSDDILSVITYTTATASTLDSAGIKGFIDSAYVAARVTIPRFGADFIDSGAALTLIDANALDSGRATPLITTLIDANALDSGRAISLIDSAYVQLRQSGGAITVQEEGSSLSTSCLLYTSPSPRDRG